MGLSMCLKSSFTPGAGGEVDPAISRYSGRTSLLRLETVSAFAVDQTRYLALSDVPERLQIGFLCHTELGHLLFGFPAPLRHGLYFGR